MRTLIVTVSDRCSKGEADDASGPAILEILDDHFARKLQRKISSSPSPMSESSLPETSYQVTSALVPDELHRIQRIVTQATDRTDPMFPNLVLLTGGTGFAQRDITPEAIRPLLDKEAPGLVQYMLTVSLEVTPCAWLSRAVAGVRKRTIIITLPGSPKAVKEILPHLLANGLEHAVDLASGEIPSSTVAHPNGSPASGNSGVSDGPSLSIPRANRSPSRTRSDHQQQQQPVTPDQKQGYGQQPLPSPRSWHHPLRAPVAAVGQSIMLGMTPRRVDPSGPRNEGASSTSPKTGGGPAAHDHSIVSLRLPSTSPRSVSGHAHDVTAASKHNITATVAARDRESTYPMMPMADALACIQHVCAASGGARQRTRLPTVRALGHVLAESVVSAFPHPPFRASVKDGYAVVADDGPGLYSVVGALCAGDHNEDVLQPKQVCRVNTGGLVPDGADAVVQVEDTKAIDVSPEGEELTVLIMSRAKKGQDIRPVGCDLPAGGVAIERGAVIHAPEVGLAMSVGATFLDVYRKPVVAVLSTGDELEEASAPKWSQTGLSSTPAAGAVPSRGKIFDSNKGMLLAAVVESGFEAYDAGIARDNMADTAQKLLAAWDAADVVISSGGVSMGEVDCVKRVLLDMGATIHFGRVNMKPGKPTTFASLGKKLFFALPGNPVSAMVCYHLFVVPALKALAGLPTEPLIVEALLQQDFKLDKERPEYHRCILRRREDCGGGDGVAAFTATSTGVQASHRLLSMSGANGMVVLAAGDGCLTRGTVADVIVIGELQ